jgi:hypothetical protein
MVMTLFLWALGVVLFVSIHQAWRSLDTYSDTEEAMPTWMEQRQTSTKVPE